MKEILKISSTILLLLLILNFKENKLDYHLYTNVEPDPYDLEFSLKRCTQYHPVESECNEDPFHTADMTNVNLEKIKRKEQKLCAFSYDVIKKYKLIFGDQFDIWTSEGYYLGRWRFCDRMNKRINETVDLMIHPDDKATMYNYVMLRRVKKEGS